MKTANSVKMTVSKVSGRCLFNALNLLREGVDESDYRRTQHKAL